MNQILIERRAFLKTGGALVVAFAFSPALEALAQTAPAGKSLAADAVDSYLVIGRDNSVTLYTGKVDMGTGAITATATYVGGTGLPPPSPARCSAVAH